MYFEHTRIGMISLDYYNSIFNHDAEKVSKMITLIRKDFEKMEASFFKADSERDILRMRAEIHKMMPIISNLKYQEFITVAEQYRNCQQYDDRINSLNKELKQCLGQLYAFLDKGCSTNF